jgi:transposase
MYRLREMLRLHRMGTSCHEVARLLQMSPNTERKYRLAIEAAGLLHGEPDQLPDMVALRAAVKRGVTFSDAVGPASSAEPYAAQLETMLRKGAGPRAIYDALKLEEGEAFTVSYDAVKRLCRRIKRHFEPTAEDVLIPVDTKPGQVAQVDFGEVCRLVDPQTGERRRAWVFVMVLGFSRHMFARIVFDQKVETWLSLHVAAFEALGGVPDCVVPDNLKAAVIRAAFTQSEMPTLNRSYRGLAEFYRFKIDPAPPREPKKKGKVESAVNYVKSNFVKPRSLTDIDSANAALTEWVEQTAGQRTHGTTGKKPLEVFNSVEQAVLGPLPAKAYVPVVWQKARVKIDSHVLFARRLYSVPWRLIGKDLWIRATPTSVEVYADDARVATHARRGTSRRSTTDAHLPKHRGELRHRDPQYWQDRADAMDPVVGAYIREVLESDSVLSQLRAVQRIIATLDAYPRERAVATCRRASFYGLFRASGIRRILEDHLDAQPLPIPVMPAQSPRTPARYARTAAELMALPVEMLNEPC